MGHGKAPNEKRKEESPGGEEEKDAKAEVTNVVPKNVVFYDIFDEKEKSLDFKAVGYGSLNKKNTSWDVETYTNTINHMRVYYVTS